MSWPYAYTPTLWPSFVTVVFLIALSVYGWRRRSEPGALVFAISCLFAALWVGRLGHGSGRSDVATSISWYQFQGVWTLPAATALTCFILEYAWPGRWLTRRNLALLSILAAGPGFVLTNDLHHLAWRGSHMMEWLSRCAAWATGCFSLMAMRWAS